MFRHATRRNLDFTHLAVIEQDTDDDVTMLDAFNCSSAPPHHDEFLIQTKDLPKPVGI